VLRHSGKKYQLKKESGDDIVAKSMGTVSVFTYGELHPSTTVKAAFRDMHLYH